MNFCTIFDDGEAGTWLDAIFHSPRLKVRDYAGGNHSNCLAPASVDQPFHTEGVHDV